MSEADRQTLFNDLYHRAYDCAAVYTAHRIYTCMKQGGVSFPADGMRVSQILESLSAIAERRDDVFWALGFLTQQQVLTANGSNLYPGPKAEQAGLEAWQFLPHVVVQPTKTLIDLVSERWLDLVAGRSRSVPVLRDSEGRRVWTAYFHNRHDLYAPLNQWAAEKLADLLEAERGSVLELGAGHGSAAASLLAECALRRIRIPDYTLSDVNLSLLAQTAGKLSNRYKQTSFVTRYVNVNRLDQLEMEQFSYIYAVDVMSWAHDLAEVAARLRTLLKPGGAAVVAEFVRQNPGSKLFQEFFYSLVPGIRRMRSEGELSVRFGFATLPEWQQAFSRAGFRRSIVFANPGGSTKAAVIVGVR
ncbi:MAG: class I SAM-dependent methyltransferase [Brevibacillus sp.]|nr:class I SAM-dependent methyltransferase [Brevibacillus sp.]